MSRSFSVFSVQFKAMGCPCEIALYADSAETAQKAIVSARRVIERLEQRYSRYRESSLLSQVHRAAGSGVPTPIDAETVALLDYADQLYRLSDGLFDITSGVLRRAWDFHAQRRPCPKQLNALLTCIGWPRVKYERTQEGGWVLLEEGMELDFGGIVKEYAADAAAKVLYQQGMVHGLIDMGGDMRVVGPTPSGQGWRIALRDPFIGSEENQKRQRMHNAVDICYGAVASSGVYERCMELNGKTYSHILDPRSGWPVEQPFSAVTVLADHAVIAGSAATLAMLLGEASGLQWLENLQLPYWVVFSDGRKVNKLQEKSPGQPPVEKVRYWAGGQWY